MFVKLVIGSDIILRLSQSVKDVSSEPHHHEVQRNTETISNYQLFLNFFCSGFRLYFYLTIGCSVGQCDLEISNEFLVARWIWTYKNLSRKLFRLSILMTGLNQNLEYSTLCSDSNKTFLFFLKIRLLFNIFYCFCVFVNKYFIYLGCVYFKK